MTHALDTTSAAFFESKYAAAEDPWNFAASPYEQARYSATCDALQGRRFRSAVEPGCSIGVLTARLVQQCDRLLACDLAATAIAHAYARCASLAVCAGCDLTLHIGSLAALPLPTALDLIVFSEIGYYFAVEELAAQRDRLLDAALPGATLLAVHWLGHSDDHVLPGQHVHDILNASPRLQRTLCAPHDGFLLERWDVTKAVGGSR